MSARRAGLGKFQAALAVTLRFLHLVASLRERHG